MVAGEQAVLKYSNAAHDAAEAWVLMGLGQLGLASSNAIELRNAEPDWKPVVDPLLEANRLYVDGLVRDVAAIRRRTWLKKVEPGRHMRAQLERIGFCWSDARVAALRLYIAAGGESDGLPSFESLKERVT
jgi:hypothetical protein